MPIDVATLQRVRAERGIGNGTTPRRARSWRNYPRGNGRIPRILQFLVVAALACVLAWVLAYPVHLLVWGLGRLARLTLLDYGNWWQLPSSDAASTYVWYGRCIDIAAIIIAVSVATRIVRWVRRSRDDRPDDQAAPARWRVILRTALAIIGIAALVGAIVMGALLSARALAETHAQKAQVLAVGKSFVAQTVSDQHQANTWLANPHATAAMKATVASLQTDLGRQATRANTAWARLQKASLVSDVQTDLDHLLAIKNQANADLKKLQGELPKA